MRKMSDKAILFQKKRQIRLRQEDQRAANIRWDTKLRRIRFRRRYITEFSLLESRDAFRRSIYRKKYTEKRKTVYIEGDFGIEDGSRIDYFFEKAVEIIDFNNRELNIDLTKCTRIWPSAITMLCSLKQWVELSTMQLRQVPIIKSSASNSTYVNSYLKHCGFYEYVNRPSDDVKSDYYSDEQVVKIRREKKTSNIEIREDEIIDLLKKLSTLDENQISEFNCIVLTEILNNVTEHGITYRDKGWWVLAQYHGRHGFISLCIADNGIGLRNILMTGPQKADIHIDNDPLNDDKFIKKALTEQISGAILAPKKTERYLLLSKRYKRGSHRGNGLKRISATCEKLKIPFAIISHNGFVFVDQNGKIAKIGAMPKKVFAGTLHHFLIPAKREEVNNENS